MKDKLATRLAAARIKARQRDVKALNELHRAESGVLKAAKAWQIKWLNYAARDPIVFGAAHRLNNAVARLREAEKKAKCSA